MGYKNGRYSDDLRIILNKHLKQKHNKMWSQKGWLTFMALNLNESYEKNTVR